MPSCCTANIYVVFTQTENVLSTGIERTCFIYNYTHHNYDLLFNFKTGESVAELAGHKESENEATSQLTLPLYIVSFADSLLLSLHALTACVLCEPLSLS